MIEPLLELNIYWINKIIEHHLPLIQRAEERNCLGIDDSHNDSYEERSGSQPVEIDALQKEKDKFFEEIENIEERIKSLEVQYESNWKLFEFGFQKLSFLFFFTLPTTCSCGIFSFVQENL